MGGRPPRLIAAREFDSRSAGGGFDVENPDRVHRAGDDFELDPEIVDCLNQSIITKNANSEWTIQLLLIDRAEGARTARGKPDVDDGRTPRGLFSPLARNR